MLLTNLCFFCFLTEGGRQKRPWSPMVEENKNFFFRKHHANIKERAMAAWECQFLFHCIKPVISRSFSFSCKNAGYAQNVFGTMAHYTFFPEILPTSATYMPSE